MSPGTSCSAGRLGFTTPLRIQRAFSDCIFFSALRADSALFSCHTPTIAFKINISNITKGSTKAVTLLSPPFSKKERTNESTADSKNLNQIVFNCSKISSKGELEVLRREHSVRKHFDVSKLLHLLIHCLYSHHNRASSFLHCMNAEKAFLGPENDEKLFLTSRAQQTIDQRLTGTIFQKYLASYASNEKFLEKWAFIEQTRI